MIPDTVMMVYVAETTYAPEMVYGMRRDVQTNHGIMHVEVFDKLAFSVDCVEKVLMDMLKSYGRYVKGQEDGKPLTPNRLEDSVEIIAHTVVGVRLHLTARWEEKKLMGLDSLPCMLRDAEDAVNSGDISVHQAREVLSHSCSCGMPVRAALKELGYVKADYNPDMEREFFRCVAEMGSKALDPACLDELVQRVMEACSVKPNPSCLEAYAKRMLKLQ